MKRSAALLFASLAVFSTTAAAANYTNEVLSIGVGARALGMGGAYVGLADDSTAVYWNPAGLPKIKNIEVAAVQQGRQYGDSGLNEVGSQYFFLSGGMSVPKIGTFGAAIMRFGVNDIPQVTGVDSSGAPIQVGTFKTEDLALLVSYGVRLNQVFSLGLTGKSLSSKTSGLQSTSTVPGDATSQYYGTDVGMLVDFVGFSPSLEGLTFGMNAQDFFGTGVQWKNTPSEPSEAVDLNPKLGLAYSLPFAFLREGHNKLTLAIDGDPKYGPNALMHYGAEFWYRDTLAFRGGLRQFLGGQQGLESSLGASFRFYVLQADYAFINYELTPMHYLSLSVRF